MEFSEVVRRRRMVRRFDPDRPVEPGGGAPGPAHRGAGPERWVHPGLGLRRARRPPRTGQVLGGHRRPGAGPLDARRQRPRFDRVLRRPEAYLDRYAEPDKGWTDRDPARWPVPYWEVDTGMAALLALLSAVDQGLGAFFFGVPPRSHDAVRRALGIPASRVLVGVVGPRPRGRAGREPQPAPRPSAPGGCRARGTFGESSPDGQSV